MHVYLFISVVSNTKGADSILEISRDGRGVGFHGYILKD
jgi:hypothetical protein